MLLKQWSDKLNSWIEQAMVLVFWCLIQIQLEKTQVPKYLCLLINVLDSRNIIANWVVRVYVYKQYRILIND